jgi:hypothetical protein
VYGLSALSGMSVETLEGLDRAPLDENAVTAFLGAMGPMAPSCRRAKDSNLGFVVLEGRGGGIGGGVRLPRGRSCCEAWEETLL